MIKTSRVEKDKLLKGQYIWLGQFQKGQPDPELFSEYVDELVQMKWTMAERSNAAEHLGAHYREVTGKLPPEFDRKRLFDWIREGYRYEDYPFYDEDYFRFRRERIEVYDKKGVNGDITYLIDRKDMIKRKGGMIPFSCPFGGDEDAKSAFTRNECM